MYSIEQVRMWIGVHSYSGPTPAQSIRGVAVNSEFVQPNTLFFALAGESHKSRNGHEFLFEAAARKAALLCVEQGYMGPLPLGVGVVRVADTLASLQNLARSYLLHCRSKVIAITGSIGKTTTTQLLAQIAAPHLSMAHTHGSQNGRIGVPLTILNTLRPGQRVIALEIGMDRPGQIAHLAQLFPPDIAIITAVESAHMENFKDLGEVAGAKGELLLSPNLGTALLNADSHCLRQLQSMGRCEKKLFSTRPFPGIWIAGRLKNEMLFLHEEGRVRCQLKYPPKLGPQQLSCLIAAVAAARQLSLTFEQIASNWTALSPPKGRFNTHRRGSFTLIDDSYNASPSSVIAAIAALPERGKGGRRLAVLAKMEELGHMSERAHLDVGQSAYENLDGLICLDPAGDLIAPGWRSELKPLWRVKTLDGILSILRREARPSDTVLLKGSRRWELEQLVQPILQLFSSL